MAEAVPGPELRIRVAGMMRAPRPRPLSHPSLAVTVEDGIERGHRQDRAQHDRDASNHRIAFRTALAESPSNLSPNLVFQLALRVACDVWAVHLLIPCWRGQGNTRK